MSSNLSLRNPNIIAIKVRIGQLRNPLCVIGYYSQLVRLDETFNELQTHVNLRKEKVRQNQIVIVGEFNRIKDQVQGLVGWA